MKNIQTNRCGKDIKINQYNKRHFTKKEMICVLEERGLIVDKPKIFDNINYSYLIYNFSKPFYLKEEELKYKHWAKLSHIYNLYLFSKKASMALFGLIHDIERKFKKTIAFSISEKSVYSYLEKKSYVFKKEDLSIFNNFLKRMKKNHKFLLINKKEKIIEKLENDIIPIWIFIDRMTLSDLIKMIKYNKKLIESKIYKKMKVNKKQMFIINKFRDEIAHMNIIEQKIKYKDKNSIKTIKYKDFLKILNILIPNLKEELEKFWKKNHKLLSNSIKKEIKEKYFRLV